MRYSPWMGDGAVNLCREVLLDGQTKKRGIFRTDRIEELLNRPQRLQYDFWGKKVWMLMNVELWFREFMD